MRTIDFAIRLKREAADFYRRQAARASTPRAVATLETLAGLEDEHLKKLDALRARLGSSGPDAFGDDVHTIFSRLPDDPSVLADADGTFAHDDTEDRLYRKAQALELRFARLFRAKARRMDDPTDRWLLLHLADEEEHHALLLDDLAIMLEHPREGGWLENAEWRVADEY